MFAMRNFELLMFANNFTCAEGWEAWEMISHMKGDFYMRSQVAYLS